MEHHGLVNILPSGWHKAVPNGASTPFLQLDKNFGVGVGRKGRTETFLELHLNLLKEDHIPLLWYLFSVDALGADGTFEKLLGDSKD